MPGCGSSAGGVSEGSTSRLARSSSSGDTTSERALACAVSSSLRSAICSVPSDSAGASALAGPSLGVASAGSLGRRSAPRSAGVGADRSSGLGADESSGPGGVRSAASAAGPDAAGPGRLVGADSR